MKTIFFKTILLVSFSLLILGCADDPIPVGSSGVPPGSIGGGTTTPPPNGGGSTPTLSKIEVTPADIGILLGRTVQLTATGTFSDGTTADLTSQVVWSSSATSTATVGTSTGVVRGVIAGTGTILTATSATTTSVSGTTTLAVQTTAAVSIKQNSINLCEKAYTPANLFVPVNTTVTWTNNDVFVAHTVTSTNSTVIPCPDAGDTLSTGAMDFFVGASNSRFFNGVGVFSYACKLSTHRMRAKVTVENL